MTTQTLKHKIWFGASIALSFLATACGTGVDAKKQGLAATQSASYTSNILFAINNDGGSGVDILAYTVNMTTGALTLLKDNVLGAAYSPQWIAVSPNYKCLFTFDTDKNVRSFTINGRTGAITLVAASGAMLTATAPAAGTPTGAIAVNPSLTKPVVYAASSQAAAANFGAVPYDINTCRFGTLSQYNLQSNAAAALGTASLGLALDSTGSTLYVSGKTAGGAAAVNRFPLGSTSFVGDLGAASGATVTATATAASIGGGIGSGLAVDQNASFVYTSNTSELARTTGSFANAAVIVANATDNGTVCPGVALSPASSYLVQACTAAGTLGLYSTVPSTGAAFSAAGNNAVGTGQAAADYANADVLSGIQFHPTNNLLLFVGNYTKGKLYPYVLNSAGTITSVSVNPLTIPSGAATLGGFVLAMPTYQM